MANLHRKQIRIKQVKRSLSEVSRWGIGENVAAEYKRNGSQKCESENEPHKGLGGFDKVWVILSGIRLRRS